MYILYGGRFTRALMVEMVMAEGGIPYELRNVDIVAHEHRRPEYLAVNPAGWVPALLTPEGETLYETPAINLYLGGAPWPGPPRPRDRRARAGSLPERTLQRHRRPGADPEALLLPPPLRAARRRPRSDEGTGARRGARTPAGDGGAPRRQGALSPGSAFQPRGPHTVLLGPRSSMTPGRSSRCPHSGAAWTSSPRGPGSVPTSRISGHGGTSTPRCRRAAKASGRPFRGTDSSGRPNPSTEAAIGRKQGEIEVAGLHLLAGAARLGPIEIRRSDAGDIEDPGRLLGSVNCIFRLSMPWASAIFLETRQPCREGPSTNASSVSEPLVAARLLPEALVQGPPVKRVVVGVALAHRDVRELNLGLGDRLHVGAELFTDRA